MPPKVPEEAAPVGLFIQGCLPCAGNGPRRVSLQPLQPGLGLLLISAEQGTQALPPQACPYGWPCSSLLGGNRSQSASLSLLHRSVLPLTLLSA